MWCCGWFTVGHTTWALPCSVPEISSLTIARAKGRSEHPKNYRGKNVKPRNERMGSQEVKMMKMIWIPCDDSQFPRMLSSKRPSTSWTFKLQIILSASRGHCTAVAQRFIFVTSGAWSPIGNNERQVEGISSKIRQYVLKHIFYYGEFSSVVFDCPKGI